MCLERNINAALFNIDGQGKGEETRLTKENIVASKYPGLYRYHFRLTTVPPGWQLGVQEVDSQLSRLKRHLK